MKLPQVTAQDLIKVLTKLGFKTTRQKGSHVQLEDQKRRVVTVPAHPGRDIGRGLLRKILRDAELSVEELARLL